MRDVKHAVRYWFLRWRGMVWPWTRSGGLLLCMAVALGSQTVTLHLPEDGGGRFTIDVQDMNTKKAMRRTFQCGRIQGLLDTAGAVGAEESITKQVTNLWKDAGCDVILEFMEGKFDK